MVAQAYQGALSLRDLLGSMALYQAAVQVLKQGQEPVAPEADKDDGLMLELASRSEVLE